LTPLALDARGRARWAWVEDICARSWPELLEDGMREVSRGAQELFEKAIRTECGGLAEVLSRDIPDLSATLALADVRRDGSLMTCQLDGELWVTYDVLLEDVDPEFPLESSSHAQVDVQMDIPFLLTVSWDLAAPDTLAPTTTTVEITADPADAVHVGVDRRMK
jgi:hypothetical protein